MWSYRGATSFVPMWKLVCAVAVSSGVMAFPLVATKKDTTHWNPAQDWTILQTLHQRIPSGCCHCTACEAVPLAQLDEEEYFEKMPIPDRGLIGDGHAIFNLLLGKHMVESYDIYMRPKGSSSDNVIVAYVKFGDKVNGHPGVVHGGITSLIFDDFLGFGFGALGIEKAFTANLSVDYRAPIPACTKVKVEAQLDHREGRKLFWKAQMKSVDGETLYAECSCLYIIPRSHA